MMLKECFPSHGRMNWKGISKMLSKLLSTESIQIITCSFLRDAPLDFWGAEMVGSFLKKKENSPSSWGWKKKRGTKNHPLSPGEIFFEIFRRKFTLAKVTKKKKSPPVKRRKNITPDKTSYPPPKSNDVSLNIALNLLEGFQSHFYLSGEKVHGLHICPTK